MRTIGRVIAAGALTAAVPAAWASQTFYFSIYENADGADLTGLSLWVKVTDQTSYADLEFGNSSVNPNDEAVVTKIMFEKTAFSSMYLGAFGGIVGGEEAPGVDFSVGGFTGIGGDLWNHNTDTLWQVDADPPPVQKGIDPGEYLPLRVQYANGGTYNDLVAALGDGSFRIVMHIQAVGSDSDSVWGVTHVIPLPSAAGLGLAGLLLVGAHRRR